MTGPRHVVADGERGVFVPVGACRLTVAMIELACRVEARDGGPGWRPHPDVASVLRMLRVAPLIDDLADDDLAPVSDIRSAHRGAGDHGLMTTSDVADVLGVTPDRVGQLCRAGAFPGATRIGRSWAIPSDEVA